MMAYLNQSIGQDMSVNFVSFHILKLFLFLTDHVLHFLHLATTTECYDCTTTSKFLNKVKLKLFFTFTEHKL